MITIPEVYQIELSNRCNLKCPNCLRSTNVEETGDLDLVLIDKMIERGDFGGSYYVELQLAGEPTLHLKMGEAIDKLHSAGLLVGASTHGHLIGKKAGVIEDLLKLDALTISVDSTDPETYAKLRPPVNLKQLFDKIEVFYREWYRRWKQGERVPSVDLQSLAITGVPESGDLNQLTALKESLWPEFDTRLVGDCFDEMQGRLVRKKKRDLCLNPFMSVSVNHKGDVLSCCYIFDGHQDHEMPNRYGNLFEQSLVEIWNGPKATAMRESQQRGESLGRCAQCELRSPVKIHIDIVSRLVRKEKR